MWVHEAAEHLGYRLRQPREEEKEKKHKSTHEDIVESKKEKV